LIIEDSSLDADRLSKYLKLLDIASITHPTGAGAVELAIEIQPDVIFLDLLLPDISGWDVMESLRTHERTSHIPIVVTSVEEDRERASRLGAAGYLVKLFTQSDLYNAIARLQRTSVTSPLQESFDTLQLETSLETVMLVDDNEINTLVLEDFLRSKRFQVVTSRSGLDFLSRVEEIQPDVVLMDIQMPGIDGLETTRRLRSHPDVRLAAIPVIAITALAMPGDRERCLAAGANEYLSKPLRLEELRTNIQKYIKKDVETNE
jgi:CheY-like chemotaxis protein